MKAHYIFVTLLITLFFGCASSKSKASPEEIEQLKTLIESKHLRIESEWAEPMTTLAMQQILNSGLLPPNSTPNRISLLGNSNFLEIKGDSVTSYLPYFGERQMQIGYGNQDSAIQLTGLIEDFSVEAQKNNNFLVKFDAKNLKNNENFQVFLTLTPGLSSTLILNSASRRSIRYSGSAEKVSSDLK